MEKVVSGPGFDARASGHNGKFVTVLERAQEYAVDVLRAGLEVQINVGFVRCQRRVLKQHLFQDLKQDEPDLFALFVAGGGSGEVALQNQNQNHQMWIDGRGLGSYQNL